MKRYAIFSEADGKFLQTVDCDHTQIDGCLPPGHRAFEAVELPHCKRFDQAAGELVEALPPQPDADHEWVPRAGRWMLKEAALDRVHRKRVAQDRIEALEKQQARALREERIGRGGTPAELRKRLEDIDDQIVALRAIVNS